MRNILKKVMSFLIVISFVFMLYSVGNSIVMQYKKYQVSSEIEQVVALMKDTNTTSKHSLDYYKKYYQNDNIIQITGRYYQKDNKLERMQMQEEKNYGR